MSVRRALGRVLATALVLASGCRSATVPYDLAAVVARTKPIHARSLAVVPFIDARQGSDRDGDESTFVYSGTAFRATDLRQLKGTPERAFAELFARHLVRAGVFKAVILADRIEDAPEADLVLSARIRRARGYVEAEARPESSKKPRDERTVLSEMWLEGVTIQERGGQKRALFAADLGWSVLAERKGEPDPWAVLGEALQIALTQGVRLLERADLEGGYVVKGEVALGTATSSGAPALEALTEAAPPGWIANTSTASPAGWKHVSGACKSALLKAAQTQRFNRVLGPYVPTVAVSWCASDARLTMDDRAEFPAIYLGKSPRGGHVFVDTIGENDWPHAVDQISRFFVIQAPADRHIFVIGP